MPKEALLYTKSVNNAVFCRLCAHSCNITEGKFGICGVRQNEGGTLYSRVYGKPIALHIDPIEKKPIFHLLPGSGSYSLATAGCNFKCNFCQNWELSQLSKGKDIAITNTLVKPEEIIAQALSHKCNSISYTYTEPTVFFEYAYDIGKLAKAKGLYNVFVTNGYMNPECLDMLKGILDAANVDLKSFREGFYERICGARLKPVLEVIRYMRKLNIWVEVTTLVVPGENDSEEELKDIAEFLSDTGKEIPWHISRFHPDYNMTTKSPTPVKTLQKAREIGFKAGLRYVYTGNIPGDEGENTLCYNCGKLLIGRFGFQILENNITDSKCRFCNAVIDGAAL
ncbi:MAG: AmmeMemoRadiSam system radical SAM enzyme [Candidatus Omnitrophota bacterium]